MVRLYDSRISPSACSSSGLRCASTGPNAYRSFAISGVVTCTPRSGRRLEHGAQARGRVGVDQRDQPGRAQQRLAVREQELVRAHRVARVDARERAPRGVRRRRVSTPHSSTSGIRLEQRNQGESLVRVTDDAEALAQARALPAYRASIATRTTISTRRPVASSIRRTGMRISLAAAVHRSGALDLEALLGSARARRRSPR